MKLFNFILAITLALSLFSCSKESNTDPLIRKWKITETEPAANGSTSLKDATIQFFENGQCSASEKNANNIEMYNGTWHWIQPKKLIQMNLESESETMEVIKLNNSEFWFSFTDQSEFEVIKCFAID